MCQRHEQCGILDGKELSLSVLGGAIRKKQDEVLNEIKTRLLHGFNKHLPYNFWDQVGRLSDNYSDKREGFSFTSHPGNIYNVNKWRHQFSVHLTNEGFITKEGVIQNSTKNEFFKAVESLKKAMFWVLQVTGGAPARSTEMVTLLLENGKFDCRNFFIQQGRLFYVLLVHKGREKLRGLSRDSIEAYR